MSYQDFLRSTSNPERPNSASPAPVIHRKPPPSYATLPINTSPGTVYKTVTQYNNLRSASTSSHGPSASPSISNGSQSHSPMPASSPATMKSSTEPPSSLPPSTPLPSVPDQASTPTSIPTPTSAPTTIITHTPNSLPPQSKPSTPPSNPWDPALQTCLALQLDATTHHNKRPFAALLLAPNHSTILHTHFSISHVQHAECELARLATIHYTPSYLRHCTLVSTWEPCAMCAATIYWSGIGRVVYAASEKALRDLTGINNGENLTMDLPCRDVFNAGQTKVDVVGPVSGWEEKVIEESRKWWKRHATNPGVRDGVNGKSTGAAASARSVSASAVVTNPVPDEGVLSRIGEDGEYKADLKVDWMMR